MPTYEYVCTECGQGLEVVQSFTDAALTECPACSGRLRKVFGNVGVSFKGSGFYKTDSQSKSAPKTETKAETKAETKTETKTESAPSTPSTPSPSSEKAS